jgi:hypothetical protein
VAAVRLVTQVMAALALVPVTPMVLPVLVAVVAAVLVAITLAAVEAA